MDFLDTADIQVQESLDIRDSLELGLVVSVGTPGSADCLGIPDTAQPVDIQGFLDHLATVVSAG